jgi:methyl-accepting chemotaxis protein
MKIRHILLGLGLLGFAFTMVVGTVGWLGIRTLGSSMDASVVATEATQDATMGDMMHDALRGDVYGALMHAQDGDQAALAQLQKDAKEHGDEFLARTHALQKLQLPPEIRQGIDAAEPIVARYAAAGLEITQMAASNPPAAHDKLSAFRDLFLQLEAVQAHYIEAIEAHARATKDTGQAARLSTQWAMLAATLIGALLLVTAAAWVARYLMHILGDEPLAVRLMLKRVSAGDLGLNAGHDAKHADSLVASLADTVTQLRSTVHDVRANADCVANASAEVSSGSTDLAARTQDQAAALERSVTALEQLSVTVRQNADSAVQASDLAQGATKIAGQGGQVVEQLVTTMQDIHQASQKIADIISVIDGIAFQTNILALNAAVEAARAGEQGRGFAVVAGEVRNLAQRSAEAAREIKSLITSSVERVTLGAQQADHAGETMKNVVSSISKVTDIVATISRANREQTEGISQVAQVVSQMDRNTQSNAALVEETASAAASLRLQADLLARSVAVFKLA